jgi:hypothetical protein
LVEKKGQFCCRTAKCLDFLLDFLSPHQELLSPHLPPTDTHMPPKQGRDKSPGKGKSRKQVLEERRKAAEEEAARLAEEGPSSDPSNACGA